MDICLYRQRSTENGGKSFILNNELENANRWVARGISSTVILLSR